MLKRKFHYLLILIVFPGLANAQEFNCTVQVNDEQLEGTSFGYVKQNLPVDIESYINEFRWTEAEFLEQERINCQISIILKTGSQNSDFSAEAIIQARRPIYNTTTETTTIILSEPTWQFNYPEGKSLIHDELQFDPLTGLLDYYCYLMLGYDFDSFSELGGTPYFIKAQNVVDLAQTSNAIGWARNSNNRRNKLTLIEDLLNNNYQPLRVAYYTYHRKGLDTFTRSQVQARQQVLAALEGIQTAKRRTTNNYLYDLFFDTKSREISSIFADAESQIQLRAFNILRDTDPGHSTEYQNLQN